MLIQCRAEGDKDSPICFVGEAPGTEEVNRGLPFQGAGGRLLNRLMATAGILRNNCYITNAIKIRPPANDVSEFITIKRTRYGVQTFETDVYKEHVAYLLDELAQTKANVIVVLGATALYATTGLYGITSYRGSILEGIGPLKGRKIIPTFHPAHALRNPEYEHIILQDFRRVKFDSEFPELRRPDTELIVLPSYDQTVGYLEHILDTKCTVGADIETIHKQLSCISFAASGQSSICIPFIYKGQDYYNPDQEQQIMLLIEQILTSSEIKKIFQNAIFDMTFLYHTFGIVTQNYEDTMIAHYALFQDLPKGLDFLCSMFTREPYYKDDGKEAFRGYIPDYEQYYRYNAKDSLVLHEILRKVLYHLEKFDNMGTYEVHRDILPALMYFQERGIKVAVDKITSFTDTLNKRMLEAQGKLDTLAGESMNVNSPKQLKEYFYNKKKFKPYVKSAGFGQPSKPSLDNDALKRLIIKGSEEARLIQELRKDHKLRSTYLEMDFDIDGRIRSGYNPVGAVTGRISSRKTIWDTGGNMQNLPKAFKKFLIADPGHVLFEVDLSQAENRIVAFLAPEHKLIRAFNTGTDIHKLTASLVFGIPYEEVSAELGSSVLGDGTKSQRDWGKRCNHAFNYGLGAKTFALQYEIKESDARALLEQYHRMYAGIRGSYHVNVEHELNVKGFLTNPFGRRRRFLMSHYSGALSTEAYSFKPQSTVGDIINRWGLIYFMRELADTDAIELLNQVHDSVVGQIRIDKLEEGVEKLFRLCQSLTQPVPHTTPFVIPVDVKIGQNLKDMENVVFTKRNTEEFFVEFQTTLAGVA